MQPDDNPNHLAPQTGAGQGQIALRKAPLAVVLVVGLGLLGVLAYSIHKESGRKAPPAASIKAEPEKPFLPPAAGSGLVAPRKPEPAKSPPEANQTALPLITVVPVQTDKRAEALRREQDQLRQQRRKLQQTALASPLKAIKGKEADPAAEGKTQERPQRVAAKADSAATAGQTSKIGQEHDEFQADSGKEAFLRRSVADDWSLGYERTPGAALELKTGGVIPALLLTGINSELPGVLIAQVGQNVFDTASGRHLLIPQGAKLYGVYDSRVVYGQSRVLVAWNRIIFPDGSALTLGAMPGADTAGYAGFTDQVETHFWRTFGTAALMSLVSGASAYALDEFGANGDSENPTMQDQMASALASQLGQTTAKLLEKNLSVKPTLQIRPGYRFNIVVTKDLVFEEPYAPWQ